MVVLLLKSTIRGILERWCDEAKRRSKAALAGQDSNIQENEEAPDSSNYRQCLERREYYMAEIKKLQVGLKKGEYVYEHEVRKAIADAIAGLRQRLMAVPNQVAAQVSATSEPEEVEKILRKAFAEAVADVPKDITEGLTMVNVEDDRAGESP